MTCGVMDASGCRRHHQAIESQPPENEMTDAGLIALACGLIIGLGAAGACMGIATMGGRFMDGAVRQPEMMEPLQGKVFLLVGVLDGAFIIATGIGLWFATANPFK